MFGISLALGGCANWPSLRPDVIDHVEYLSQALAADAREREALWKAAPATDASEGARLHVALLQSIEGHSGYDPAAARQRLEALAASAPGSVDVATVARLRLAQLNESTECRSEVADLRQRLSRVVDIEKRMNRNGH